MSVPSFSLNEMVVYNLSPVSITAAQNATQCSGEVCYAVNVPAITASSGVGDIFFQISGPSSMSWIGLGQGSSMKGSNIFMIYANSAGTNVTLSSRLGIGNQEPYYGAANVTLLAGSGISNDVMTANVRCKCSLISQHICFDNLIITRLQLQFLVGWINEPHGLGLEMDMGLPLRRYSLI